MISFACVSVAVSSAAFEKKHSSVINDVITLLCSLALFMVGYQSLHGTFTLQEARSVGVLMLICFS